MSCYTFSYFSHSFLIIFYFKVFNHEDLHIVVVIIVILNFKIIIVVIIIHTTAEISVLLISYIIYNNFL